jgi:hypothetical protein
MHDMDFGIFDIESRIAVEAINDLKAARRAGCVIEHGKVVKYRRYSKCSKAELQEGVDYLRKDMPRMLIRWTQIDPVAALQRLGLGD